MPDENVNIADALKQVYEAEGQAAALEKMLDDLDTKMDFLLEIMKSDQDSEVESINKQ